jgi:hypothetical protein
MFSCRAYACSTGTKCLFLPEMSWLPEPSPPNQSTTIDIPRMRECCQKSRLAPATSPRVEVRGMRQHERTGSKAQEGQPLKASWEPRNLGSASLSRPNTLFLHRPPCSFYSFQSAHPHIPCSFSLILVTSRVSLPSVTAPTKGIGVYQGWKS